jgi:hypothetical protein
LPQPMGHAVAPDRVYARIAESHLKSAASRGVPFPHGAQVAANDREHP